MYDVHSENQQRTVVTCDDAAHGSDHRVNFPGLRVMPFLAQVVSVCAENEKPNDKADVFYKYDFLLRLNKNAELVMTGAEPALWTSAPPRGSGENDGYEFRTEEKAVFSLMVAIIRWDLRQRLLLNFNRLFA